MELSETKYECSALIFALQDVDIDVTDWDLLEEIDGFSH